MCKRVDAWLPLNGVRPNKYRVCPEYCIAKVGAHELCKGKCTCSGCVQFPPLALDSQTFWNLSVTFQITHLPQDHNRRLRKQLLGLPYCFPLFFSPYFLVSYFKYFMEHISLISYQIPSVGLSFHPHFTILTSSAVLDRLNICSRRKTWVYVSPAYAETMTIR